MSGFSFRLLVTLTAATKQEVGAVGPNGSSRCHLRRAALRTFFALFLVIMKGLNPAQ